MAAPSTRSFPFIPTACALLLLAAGAGLYIFSSSSSKPAEPDPIPEPEPVVHKYKRRMFVDTSGYWATFDKRQPSWADAKSLDEVAAAHERHVADSLAIVSDDKQTQFMPLATRKLTWAGLLHSRGRASEAFQVLLGLEAEIRGSELEDDVLYTVIYYLGVTGLRMGENDNCVMCRGESACIFPIAPGAVHTNTFGSRKAIEYFTEYLRVFPDDFEVAWLLNVAHMTLGEHPHGVAERHRLLLDPFTKPDEFGIGAFRDVSHLTGLERYNQSGGAIMDDFDNDGLYDIVVTDWSPSNPMAFYRNKGDGTFEERTKAAGLEGQKGGLYCVQTDFNNDGHLDIFIPRGAWLPANMPIRPSLMKNNGNGTFTDVTKEAGLDMPVNSNSASWADFDNDGHVDVIFSGHWKPYLLYRNKGDGTFENVTARAGLPTEVSSIMGFAWLDYDNDGFPDLFVNVGAPPGGRVHAAVPDTGTAVLYHNNRNGTFTEVTREMGIARPTGGFSCWAWDFDNDGWIDIYATSAIHSLEDIVNGILHRSHELPTPTLYRNMQGKGFKDVTKEFGLDVLCAPMGSNFGDFDNDGYLDFYLATGNPDLSTLIPNRLFRNIEGKRFKEITASSRTGHLQKGHGVAIGDWNRDGNQDLFVELGGAVPGDRYHNVLFQNPGQSNNWISIKLTGQKTNRAAIGARIKVTTAGEKPLTVHRHVTSGSSFGANPLEQHIGLGKADRVAKIEIHWPTSGTTQVFENVKVNQNLIVTEFAKEYQTRNVKAFEVPK